MSLVGKKVRILGRPWRGEFGTIVEENVKTIFGNRTRIRIDTVQVGIGSPFETLLGPADFEIVRPMPPQRRQRGIKRWPR